MTDKTFTDEEIVKALEVCAINTVSREGFFTYQGIPLRYLCKDALDLINRQKAEIGRLNKELDELAEELSDLIVEKDILFDIAEKAKPFFSPEDVRKMTPEQVRENYSAIMDSMKKWS